MTLCKRLFLCFAVVLIACPAQGAIQDDLVAYWPLDGDFMDGVGGHHGEERGSTPIAFEPAMFGEGIRLNGENQFVEITGGAVDALDFVGESMSVSAWFTVDAFDTDWQALIAKGEQTAWRVHRRGGEPRMTFAGGIGEAAAGGPDVTDGGFHHIAAISEAGVSTRVWVDGELVETGGVPNITLPTTNNRVRIGDNPSTNNREWEGFIDDVAIWNRVLTDEEIASIWSGGTGNSLAGLLNPGLPGDFNGDDVVNLDDFNIMVGNFNGPGTFAEGDFDFNGRINLEDFVQFREAFHAQGAAVPEPSSLLLGVLGLALLGGKRLVRGMSRKKAAFFLAIAAATGILATSNDALAQVTNINWNVAGPANYLDNANWDLGGVPSPVPEATFAEGANIGNAGAAFLEGAAPDVARVTVGNGTLEIRAGGSLVSVADTIDPSFGFGQIGGNGILRLMGTAQLEIQKNLTNNGRIELLSPDVDLSVGGDFSNGNGTLHYAISSNATIGVGGTAILGGTVVADFGGNTPAFGDSLDIIQAGSVTGSFSSVQLGPGDPAFANGLVLAAKNNNGTVSLEVENRLIATVDRASGDISVRNAVGGPVEVTSYSLTSAGGLLNPAGWTSLASLGSPGWLEANPNANALTELNLTETGSLNVGDQVGLGTSYAAANILPADEDVRFQYTGVDGRLLDGIVEYSGPANMLTLRVDPETGEAAMQNLSQFTDPFDVIGYSILSASGALSTDGWMSFQDSGNAGDGWIEANPQSNALAELNLDNSTIFDNGDSINLGNLFTPGSAQDLNFRFSTLDGQTRDGVVEFGALAAPPEFLDSDFNKDGTVDLSDFNILKGNFGASGATMADGDANMDGNVNLEDFNVLKGQFGQSSAAVPEPSTWLLALAGCFFVAPRLVRGNFSRLCLAKSMSLLAIASLLAGTVAAVDFDVRYIRLDPNAPGPNTQINTTTEARGIVEGTVVDVVKIDDLNGTLGAIDLAGGTGNFPIDNPYLVTGDNSDFVTRVSGWLEIPEGDWTIGFGSDDGGLVNIPAARFTSTFGEGGATAGDGEIIMNGTRGHQWTTGEFTAPAGGLQTFFEAYMFERGGGDSLEVAIFEGLGGTTDAAAIGANWTILEDGALGWSVIDFNPTPGDFNSDGNVDLDDYNTLVANYGTGTEFRDGDNNIDGFVDLTDFAEFRAIFSGQAAAVPEPATLVLLSLGGVIGLVSALRRRRRQ